MISKALITNKEICMGPCYRLIYMREQKMLGVFTQPGLCVAREAITATGERRHIIAVMARAKGNPAIWNAGI